MALVLPAELLQVSYAAQLRSYLVDRFSQIDIIACNELFFERAEQGSSLTSGRRRNSGSLGPKSMPHYDDRRRNRR